MALLSGLPTELILQIFEYLPPEDIENFAAVSRRVSTIAAPIVHEHRKLIRQYERVGYDDRHLDTLQSALECFVASPSLGYYVRILSASQNLRRWDEAGYEAYDETLDTAISMESNLPQYFQDHRESWPQSNIAFTSKSPIILLFLPNLTSLHIDDVRGWREFMRALFLDHDPGKSRLHSNLRNLSFGPSYEDDPNDLQLIQAAVVWPSVRRLDASRVSDLAGIFSMPPGNRHSRITHLSLRVCGIRISRLAQLIARMDDLQVFDYTRAGYPRSDVDITDLLSALGTHARHSLVDLSLLAMPARLRHFDTLAKYTKLEKLHIDWECLITSRGEYSVANLLPKRLRQRSLASFLPRTIRTVMFN